MLSRMGQPANLLIGTPAYGGQVHVDYVNSLLVFQRQGIAFTLMTIGNESLITRARNTIISTFHARQEFGRRWQRADPPSPVSPLWAILLINTGVGQAASARTRPANHTGVTMRA